MLYFKHWIKDKKTASITPSSPSYSKLIIKYLNLTNAKYIVELGCGSGPFTQEVAQNIRKQTKYFAIEINPELAKVAQQKCPNTKIYIDSGENFQKYLGKGKKCDRIIYSMPWSFLDIKNNNGLLNKIYDSLEKNGLLIIMVFIGSYFSKRRKNLEAKLKQLFKKVNKSEICWANIPPALFFVCKK